MGPSVLPAALPNDDAIVRFVVAPLLDQNDE